MKAKVLKLMVLLIISSTITSCNSNDNDTGFTPTLPPITQTGANTFGCYIDGKLLVPRDGEGTIFGPDSGMIYYGISTGGFNDLVVHDYVSETAGIVKIHFINLEENDVGEYILEESNCQWSSYANPTFNLHCRIWDEATQADKWYCSIENSGILNITRNNNLNYMLSGTFYSTLVNRDDPNDFIEITQGRFDIHTPTLPSIVFP